MPAVASTPSSRGSSRILELIEWLACQPDLVTLADVVHSFGWPKSSTLLLLRALVSGNYVVRYPGNRYQLVRLPGEPSAENQAWGTILRIVEPILSDAVTSVKETGFIAVLTHDQQVRYLNKILPTREIRYDRDIKRTRIPHYVAGGLMLLAGMDSSEFSAYLKTIDPKSGENIQTIKDRVQEARETGCVVNLQGRVEGASGVAAPIVDASGHFIAAINIAGPRERVTKHLDKVISTTIETARRASEMLERRIPMTEGLSNRKVEHHYS